MIVAVLGGGQLGRMLGLAGIPLGASFRFLEPSATCPASAVGEIVVGAYDDPEALARLVDGADVATFEFENVSAGAAHWLESHLRACRLSGESFRGLFPGAASLAVAQDRIEEKTFFQRCGLSVQSFAAVDDEPSLAAALRHVPLPALLKTRRFGYDGKGHARVDTADDALEAWRSLGEVPCILEAFVPFVREVSILAVRSRDGTVRCWPLTENVHDRGILARSRAPASDAPRVEQAARRHVTAVAEALGHVGVLAIEFFVVEAEGDLQLIANEMAPRVHNSGHWTIEGAVTSQFENHLRAIMGLPLGDTALRGEAAVMVNLVGTRPDPAQVLAVPGAALHDYGKDARPGRKLGHITVAGDVSLVDDASRRLMPFAPGEGPAARAVSGEPRDDDLVGETSDPRDAGPASTSA